MAKKIVKMVEERIQRPPVMNKNMEEPIVISEEDM